MFGKPSLTKEYRELIDQLEIGERNRPAHVRPTAVTDSGFESFATPGAQAVFEGFEFFGVLLNQQVSDPWTIEETGDPLVRDLSSDSPALGRTYKVYYNGVGMGRIQVTHGFHPDEGLQPEALDWYRENRAALALIDLHHLRLVPYQCALSLVSGVEFLVGPYSQREDARDRAHSRGARTLTGYLWDATRIDDHVPSFHHRVDGPYDYLYQMTAHWKDRGIDPFEKWGGDRPGQA